MFGGQVSRRIQTEKSIDEVVKLANDYFADLGHSEVIRDRVVIEKSRHSSFWAKVEIEAEFLETSSGINVIVDFEQSMKGQAWVIAFVLFWAVAIIGSIIPFIFPILAKGKIERDINRCIDRLEASIEKNIDTF